MAVGASTDTDTRLCKGCNQELPTSSFESGKNRKGPYVRNTCKSCVGIQRRQRFSVNPRSYFQQAVLYSRSSHKKNQRKNGGDQPHVLTVEDCLDLWEKQNGKCALSGVQMTHHRDGSGRKEFNASLDRIEPGGAYSKANVQLVCYRVNIMRHVLEMDMFFWWVKNLSDFSIENKD